MSAAPQDIAAERAVAGVCLNTRHGIGYVRDALDVEDFQSAVHANLFAAALAMRDVVTLEERVAFAVEFTGYAEAVVRRFISESPVMFDASLWATRVKKEAEQRHALATV